jgi:hypothetical protein
MSDLRKLLERWARLKSAARASEHDQGRQKLGPVDSGAPKAEPTFDPANLPPIESINAETELRVFLGEGVPAELTHAALRRGWSADPAIRDFVGLSENSWDFNDPSAMFGFGALKAEDIQWLAAQIVEQAEATEAKTEGHACTAPSAVRADATPGEATDHGRAPAGTPSIDPNSDREREEGPSSPTAVTASRTAGSSTSQHADDREPLRQRRHGGAMPRTG